MTEELAIGHYFKRLTAIQYEFGSTDYHVARYAALTKDFAYVQRDQRSNRTDAFGDRQQLLIGQRHHRIRRTRGRPDHRIPSQRLVDDGAQPARVAGRRHSPDDLVGRGADQLRAGLADRGGAKDAGQVIGVDAMSAAGHHEQRLAVAVEHQAVGDRTDLAAELFGRRDGGLGVGVEDSDGRLDAGGGDGGRHPGISVVHVS